MVERLRRPVVIPEDQDDVYRAMAGEPVGRQVGYPEDYRACTICRVALGEKCRSLSSKVVNGRPDGVAVELDHPHVARKRRIRRGVR